MERKSPTLLIRAALAAMGLTVAAGAWVLTREPPCQVCRLPDGSLLELRDVSYGIHHPLIEQQLWQKLLAPLLPPALQGRLVTVVGTPANRLVIWFRTSNLPQAWNLGRWIEAVDEHGCSVGRGYESGFPPSMGLSYRTGILEAFPRRQRQFRIRVCQRGAAAPIAEFTVFNPCPGPYPTWKAELFPIERPRGDLRVSLISLTAGLTRQRLRQSRPDAWLLLRSPHLLVDPTDADRSWALASFQVSEHEVPTDQWGLVGVTLRDATGNMVSYETAEGGGLARYLGLKPASIGDPVAFRPLHQAVRGRSDRTGNLSVAFPGLCPRETAWKLRATFSYVGPAGSEPSDLFWIVPHLPIPAPGEARTSPGIQSPGAALRLQGVLGRGAFGADRPLLPNANARVVVTASKGDGLTLSLRAADDRGETIVCSRDGTVNMGPYRKWWFDLKTRPRAKRMTLTFTGWKARSFEFLAQPTPA